jgi:hypothetical protein
MTKQKTTKAKSPVVPSYEPKTKLFEVTTAFVLLNENNGEVSFHQSKTEVLAFLNNNKHITEYSVTKHEVPITAYL